jgi:hypothetical protein
MGFAVAQAFKKCGGQCTWAKLPNNIRTMGRVVMPNDPFYGAVDFTKSNQGVASTQLFRWDAGAKKAVKTGPPLD